MAWTPQLLAEALQTLPELNIDIEYDEQSLIVKMNDYGDLPLNIVFTSRQIIIETVICPVSSIHQQDEFNIFLLRNQKLLPLSSVGISRVQQDEYYVAFGALSLNSSLNDVLLEMTTLADNALDLAEITEEYTHE
ncbi:YjfI family protein [Citrobacter europaeus]|uniref:YjfI family protein n=1 Tax=Citrobacter europaeus TaxID=1914243 RepID=UPI0039C34CF6